MIAILATACGSGAKASTDALKSAAAQIPTTSTTAIATTTTMRHDVAGTQLPPGAATIYVLGDSVTLGSQVQMPIALTGWSTTFDAKESRRIDQGTDIVAGRGGAMGRVLVVHLCTNWGNGDYRASAARLMEQLKGVDRVVWVTCTPWLPAVGQADDAIRALADEYPNVVIADWAKISATPGYTYSDGLHLMTPGAEALAALVAKTVGPAPLAN